MDIFQNEWNVCVCIGILLVSTGKTTVTFFQLNPTVCIPSSSSSSYNSEWIIYIYDHMAHLYMDRIKQIQTKRKNYKQTLIEMIMINQVTF